MRIKNFSLLNPDFVIDCSRINTSAEIYEIMRNKFVKRAYVYGMTYLSNPLLYDFIKIGMSAPRLGTQREYQVGERIVRQVCWVPGWLNTPPLSPNGYEFWKSIREELIPNSLLPKNFNKNYIKIPIWDMTARSNQNDIISKDNDVTLSLWAEAELISQYKKIHGKLPLLNKSDPSMSTLYTKPYISKQSFNNLFDTI
jgi:hypothetical protein